MTTRKSGEYTMPCDEHASRIIKLEVRVEDHEKRLGAGDVGFAELRKDIGALTEKVGALIGVLKWAIGGILAFVATTAGGAILWALVKSKEAITP